LDFHSNQIITAHCILEEWDLKSALLETFEFNTEHTATNIATELIRVANKWNIQDKIVCIVTNNAANMIVAVRETGWRHLPCFAHSLNLVIHDSLKGDKDLSIIKHKCKHIVSHFHQSVKSSDKLRAIQQQLKVPEHKLVQDVCTTWNSTYLMFQRYVEQHEAITATLCLLGHNDLCLSTEEVAAINKSITVLAPFLEATEDISGEQYVTISMILPLIKLLLQRCSNNQSEIPISKLLADNICQRFRTLETSSLTSVTTLLDPRFKKIPFSVASSCEPTINRIASEMASFDENPQIGALSSSSSSVSSEVSSSSSSSNSLWNAFDAKVAQSISHRTTGTDCMIEIRRYFEETNIERSINPLEWWKSNSIRFPRLCKIAKKYLSIPGPSVPS
jgi:hypothetical protein